MHPQGTVLTSALDPFSTTVIYIIIVVKSKTASTLTGRNLTALKPSVIRGFLLLCCWLSGLTELSPTFHFLRVLLVAFSSVLFGCSAALLLFPPVAVSVPLLSLLFSVISLAFVALLPRFLPFSGILSPPDELEIQHWLRHEDL